MRAATSEGAEGTIALIVAILGLVDDCRATEIDVEVYTTPDVSADSDAVVALTVDGALNCLHTMRECCVRRCDESASDDDRCCASE